MYTASAAASPAGADSPRSSAVTGLASSVLPDVRRTGTRSASRRLLVRERGMTVSGVNAERQAQP